MNWNTPVKFLPLVGPAFARRLQKLEIKTVGDLLWHIPFRYEDYSLISKIGQVQPGETLTVIGNIFSSQNRFTKYGKQIQTITLQDESGKIDAIWFNQPFIFKSLGQGIVLALSGKVSNFGGRTVFESPEYEVVRDGNPLIHTGRLVPIYPETGGVSSKWFRSRITPLLSSELTQEFLPKDISSTYKLLNLDQALHYVHFPLHLDQVTPAKHRLAFDELFLRQVAASQRRREWKNHKAITPFLTHEEKVLAFIESLPFTLTTAQKKVVREIVRDLARSVPMNRLLQGDVGSGKTVVAAIAMYVTHLNGFNSLLMAPTEILAEQHFSTLTLLLAPFQMNVELRTGSKKSSKRGTQSSMTNILVGTHALIEKSVQMDSVGLVVIDEQHRFGVRQRALLRNKGSQPHVLTMTATPIPRTMALTLYGDLDISVIDEMPKGRLPIKTWVVSTEKRSAAYTWIKKQVTSGVGQQVFIICPFITPSESLQTVKAATKEFTRLGTHVFPELRLGLLHGKMKTETKQSVLDTFRRREIDILVSTPVVEVGIDIPNATVMLVEGAERFGLAQLHQLRGRVGRRDLQSYCLLFTSEHTPETSRRLKNLEKSLTGAELAELDLKIRGSGELYGLSQHGRDFLKIASFQDRDLFEIASREAQKLIEFDPQLTSAPLLKERILSGTIAEVAPD